VCVYDILAIQGLEHCVQFKGGIFIFIRIYYTNIYMCVLDRQNVVCARGGGLGSRPIFKKFHETYAPS